MRRGGLRRGTPFLSTGTKEQLLELAKGNRMARQRWQRCRFLILDEVSMIDAALFDKLDFVARMIRGRPAPFGGIQLLLTGDFFQLPPVQKSASGVVPCAPLCAPARPLCALSGTLHAAFIRLVAPPPMMGPTFRTCRTFFQRRAGYPCANRRGCPAVVSRTAVCRPGQTPAVSNRQPRRRKLRRRQSPANRCRLTDNRLR